MYSKYILKKYFELIKEVVQSKSNKLIYEEKNKSMPYILTLFGSRNEPSIGSRIERL